MKVIVLGAGLIGKTIAKDLSNKFEVTCADANLTALNEFSGTPVSTLSFDFNNEKQLKESIQPFDLVVGAVPGFMGYNVLKNIIEAGKNVVDISFFPENPLSLDQLAKKNNVVAIVDCGVAPGLCNILAGHHDAESKINYYECLVGGLPTVRKWPYEYKAVFSPADVIEEYTRPARYVENGILVTREALSDAEYVEFENIGTLESFNTDGLRTMAVTMPHVKNMREKTLRYPGHIELMRVLRETGFFDKNEIEINGTKISPLAFTSKLLFPKWKLMKGEQDVTVMRVTIKNNTATYVYTLEDRADQLKGITSMARTTAYTCTAAVNLVLNKTYTQKGISPPEFVGAHNESFFEIINYLKERNVSLKKEIITA